MALAKKNNIAKKKKVVFVVEDDAFLVKAYQIKFAKEGVEIWVAADGNEALTFLAKEPPNMVLLDLMLPGASGFDVLAAIRASKTWGKVPVVVVTNLGQDQDIKRCQDLGIEDYMVKVNLRINDVVEKVKKYL